MVLYAAVFAVTLGLCLYAVVRYLRHDRQAMVLAFIVLMAAVSSWELLNFLVDAATTEQLKLLGKNAVNAVVYPVYVYGVLALALVYTNNERWVGLVVAGCAVQIVVTGAALVVAPELLYESHGLVTRGPFTVAGVTVDQFVTLDRTLEPMFLLLWVQGQLFVPVAGVILVRYIHQPPRVFVPGQVDAMLVGIGAPLAASFLLISGAVPPAWNPVDLSFLITAVAFALAVFRYRLLHLGPIESQQLAGIAEDPVVLLADDWVIGSNSMARALFDARSDRRATPAETFFGPVADQITRSHDADDTDIEVCVERDDGDRRFEFRTIPVRTPAGATGERLAVFRNVTAPVENRAGRWRQTELLKETAWIVADDIRND